MTQTMVEHRLDTEGADPLLLAGGQRRQHAGAGPPLRHPCDPARRPAAPLGRARGRGESRARGAPHDRAGAHGSPVRRLRHRPFRRGACGCRLLCGCGGDGAFPHRAAGIPAGDQPGARRGSGATSRRSTASRSSSRSARPAPARHIWPWPRRWRPCTGSGCGASCWRAPPWRRGGKPGLPAGRPAGEGGPVSAAALRRT